MQRTAAMSFDLDGFMAAHQRDGDHGFLLACLGRMEGGTTGFSSLELHAPLEVMARYALLPLVDVPRREGARRNIAKAARSFAEVAVPAAGEFNAPADGAGGGDLAHAPWPTIASGLSRALGRPQTLQALAMRVVQQIGGAGHGQILLRHLLTADPHLARKLLPHMRLFLRAYCEDPTTEQGAVIPQLRSLLRQSAAAIDEFLSGIARESEAAPHAGIRGMVARGQRVAAPPAGDSGDGGPFEAAATACVAAARMMLTAETELEYGWSHCLTLAEAAWGFVDSGDEGDVAATVALSYVVSFVAGLGFPGWPSLPRPNAAPTRIAALRQALGSASPEDAVAVCLGASDAEDFRVQAWREVAAAASGFEDAHLVKYVHACWRSGARHPAAERVFLAAATRLLARWLAR